MSEIIRVLALDTSTKTGWAHDNVEGNRPVSGVLRIGSYMPDHLPDTLSRLHFFVFDKVKDNGIGAVVIEKPLSVYAHAGWEGKGKFDGKARKDPDLAEALLAFVAVAQCAAACAGAAVYVSHQATVRRHFTGSGRNPDPKAAVMHRCKVLGWKYEDDNEADALSIWDYGKSILSPGWGWQSTPLLARATT